MTERIVQNSEITITMSCYENYDRGVCMREPQVRTPVPVTDVFEITKNMSVRVLCFWEFEFRFRMKSLDFLRST
jgi:hypothetical protein